MYRRKLSKLSHYCLVLHQTVKNSIFLTITVTPAVQHDLKVPSVRCDLVAAVRNHNNICKNQFVYKFDALLV